MHPFKQIELFFESTYSYNIDIGNTTTNNNNKLHYALLNSSPQGTPTEDASVTFIYSKVVKYSVKNYVEKERNN